jgi:hypothetical protein
VIEGQTISRLGGPVRGGAEVADGAGCTLLPGLIDAPVHTSAPSLALALRFGVTTELEMQGTNTRGNRQAIEDNDAVADVRSSGFGITPPGGHPAELFPEGFRPGPPPAAGASRATPARRGNWPPRSRPPKPTTDPRPVVRPC